MGRIEYSPFMIYGLRMKGKQMYWTLFSKNYSRLIDGRKNYFDWLSYLTFHLTFKKTRSTPAKLKKLTFWPWFLFFAAYISMESNSIRLYYSSPCITTSHIWPNFNAQNWSNKHRMEKKSINIRLSVFVYIRRVFVYIHGIHRFYTYREIKGERGTECGRCDVVRVVVYIYMTIYFRGLISRRLNDGNFSMGMLFQKARYEVKSDTRLLIHR